MLYFLLTLILGNMENAAAGMATLTSGVGEPLYPFLLLSRTSECVKTTKRFHKRQALFGSVSFHSVLSNHGAGVSSGAWNEFAIPALPCFAWSSVYKNKVFTWNCIRQPRKIRCRDCFPHSLLLMPERWAVRKHTARMQQHSGVTLICHHLAVFCYPGSGSLTGTNQVAVM